MESDPAIVPDSFQSGEAEESGSDTIVIGAAHHSLIAAGRGARVIYHQALSRVDEARAQARYEQEYLAAAVARRAAALESQAAAPTAESGRLYKYLLPYDLPDAGRFFGRAALLRELLDNLTCPGSRCRLAVLVGEAGLGKTSLVQAGLMPALVGAQHLPVLVRMTGSPLVESVKRSLLDDLNQTPGLAAASLNTIVRQAANLLPPGKRLFVLIDQFEAFMNHPMEARLSFINQLADCLSDPQSGTHWLLSLRSSHQAGLSAFQPAIPQPFANMVVLPGLSSEAARSAILEPARLRGLKMDPDLIETMLSDLGQDEIDPTRLQLVCHALVEHLPPGQDRLTLEAYRQTGGAAQITSRYLEETLTQRIALELRPAAWQLLAAISHRRSGAAALRELQADLTVYPELRNISAAQVLNQLENLRLVRQSGERYHLTNLDFMPCIRRWKMDQAVREKARQETVRQLQMVRNSALRGLLGGALGFSLVFLLTYSPQIFERDLLLYLSAIRLMPGGLAGLVFVLFIDLALASYRGARGAGLWITAGLSGAGAFGLALLINSLLRNVRSLTDLAMVFMEGAVWGGVAGLGTIWVMTSGRPAWQTLPVVACLCGLLLALVDPIFGAFGEPGAAWRVFAGGVILPLFLVGAAWSGRASLWRSG
jgi:hypothetical protein